MKFDKNDKMKTAALYAFLVLSAIVLVIFFFLRITPIYNFIMEMLSILSPVIGGIIIAYLLSPLLTLFETKVFCRIRKEKQYSKLRRGLSISAVIVCIAAFIYLLISIIIPQIKESYNILEENYGTVDKAVSSITSYVKNNAFFSKYYDTILRILGIDPTNGDSAIIEKIYETVDAVMPAIVGFLGRIASSIYNTVIAFVFSVYLLAYRERMRALRHKIAVALFSEKAYPKYCHVAQVTDKNFGGYLRGRLFDSAIVFLFSYIAYWALGLRFFPLLAIITGIANFIPFFGPIIGAIPVGFIVLFAQPSKVIWTIIIIVLVQQLDGKIIRPVIFGNKNSLPAVWVITSTLIFGGLFGFVGMLIGVPLFATIYRLVGDRVNMQLEKKELPVRTEDYYPAAKEVKGVKIKETLGNLFKKKDKNKKNSDNCDNNTKPGNSGNDKKSDNAGNDEKPDSTDKKD